jgi:TrpR-related protein YerC/YecD
MKKNLFNKDTNALFEAILELKTTDECRAFFQDLCTYQELDAMAQRLHVAKMLYTHHVFTDIVAETGASTATISRVNRSIKNGEEGYKAVFERLGIHEDSN